MNFFSRMFHQRKPNRNPDNEFDQLVEELVKIGRAVEDPKFSSSGFLRKRETAEEDRHPRAREIGERLNIMGGWGLMSKANQHVERILGPIPAKELSWVWHRIGDWLA